MRGWVIDSSRRRASGSSNTICRSLRRCKWPSSSTSSVPKACAISASAGWPGSTTARATLSASTMAMPKRSKARATADLPLAMPPVSPTENFADMREGPLGSNQSGQREICVHYCIACHQGQPPGGCEKRAERHGRAAPQAAAGDESEAGKRAAHRREHEDQRQLLPAKPGAERGQQLEIAVTQPALASQQAEQVKDQPQHEITSGGADDGTDRIDKCHHRRRRWLSRDRKS